MNADVLLLADALVDELTARLNVATVIDTSVSREYEVTVGLGEFTNRRVEIYPLSYNPREQRDRESKDYEFKYSFVWMRRYTPKGVINKAWVDTEVTLVQDHIVKPLDNPDGFFINCNGHEYEVTEVTVTSVYDYELLRQNKVFWSEVEVTLQKTATQLG